MSRRRRRIPTRIRCAADLFPVLSFTESFSKRKRAMFSEDGLFCEKKGSSFRYL